MAMFEEGGRHFPLHVPIDSIITIDGTLDGDRLTNVVWDGKPVMMFTQDLRTRAVLESEA
jgi:hypothetical protein